MTGIYQIWLSNTHFYGGRSVDIERRWHDHKKLLDAGTHYNKRMQRVFNKFGRFEPELIIECDDLACELYERSWLDTNYGTTDCVNVSPKSECYAWNKGIKTGPQSEEHRANMSKALTGRPELKSMLGRKHSDATREKMRLAHERRRLNKEVKDGTGI